MQELGSSAFSTNLFRYVSSFAANIGDGSFHSIFGSYNAAIFTPIEVVINAGVVDVGGFNATYGIGSWEAAAGPDGAVITLLRDEEAKRIPTVSEWGLIVLTILLLTAGTIVFRRARLAMAAA